MLEAFIVTLWIEYNGKLYMKEADSITRNCESTTKNLYKRFEELPTMKLIYHNYQNLLAHGKKKRQPAAHGRRRKCTGGLWMAVG